MGTIRLPKRLLAAALAAGLLATSASAAFADTEGHWAQEAIDKWSDHYGIINGYEDGTFRPDASITRGAFAGILDRFLKFQAASPAGTFSDTAGGYWESAVLKLHAAGVYLGTEGKALTGNTITRQQAVTMIARAFGITGAEETLPYSDADQVAAYAQAPLSEMTARGYITDSTDGRFRPAEPITRAEIVNILNNMVQVLVQEMETQLTNVVVEGEIRNFSGVTPTVVEPEEPEEPEEEPGEEPERPETPKEYPWVEPERYVDYDNYKVPVYPDVEESRLYNGDFYWEEDRLVYAGDAFETRFGIDVSAYQNRATPGEVIDWEAVAEDGVSFAMVRIGFRGTSSGSLNADAFYARNVDGALEAGLDTGVYFFSQAITVEEAIEEADYVISLLDGRELTGPVAYDWEMHDASYRVYGTSPDLATACALAFCRRIEEAGYEPMVYMSKYVGYNKFNLPQLAEYPIWFPEYKTAASEKVFPAFYYQPDIWQFTSSCSIDGIGGRVDANIQFLR